MRKLIRWLLKDVFVELEKIRVELRLLRRTVEEYKAQITDAQPMDQLEPLQPLQPLTGKKTTKAKPKRK